LGLGAALITSRLARKAGLATARAGDEQPFVVVPLAGFVVGVLAFAFALLTDEKATLVLFSGQDALSGLVADGGSVALGTLVLLIASLLCASAGAGVGPPVIIGSWSPPRPLVLEGRLGPDLQAASTGQAGYVPAPSSTNRSRRKAERARGADGGQAGAGTIAGARFGWASRR